MPSGLPATSIGLPITVFVVVSITETVRSPLLATYILSFSESYVIPIGKTPTVIGSISGVDGSVSITVFVVVSITETVLSTSLVTYILSFSESYATPNGSKPTVIGSISGVDGSVSITVFVVVSITETVPSPLLVTYIR